MPAVVRSRPGAAAAAVVAFLMRWALRVALPLAGAAAMLHLFPYRATAGGVHFRVEGSLFSRSSGLSANTTFGNWEFPHVDGLPVGAHISPENVDVVQLAGAANRNGTQYVDSLRADVSAQVPRIFGWLIGEALVGVLLGLAVAVAVNLAVRYVRNQPKRSGEWRLRLRQLAGVAVVLALVAGYGGITYNEHWARESRITGTLAALQLFPGDLSQYYVQQSKVFNVISSIAAIQAQLQDRIERSDVEASALNIMFISDMHLGTTYPLVRQYAQNFDVSLIVNTGDESVFGTRAEMTPTYIDQIRALTRVAPMIWLAGNHDSPATVDVMRRIPGVTVLGTKERQSDGSYRVGAQEVTALGLTIGAVPDPRVYGGDGAFGSNDGSVTDALERRTVDDAVRNVPALKQFDIFATHEPVAADRLVRDLPGQIRQTDAGHLHEQNADSDIVHGGQIRLIEGTTGAGGLDIAYRTKMRPPVEFSIESVSASCQFTKLTRFQIAGPPPSGGEIPTTGQQVTATTRYFEPQQLDPGRVCSTNQPVSPPRPIDASP